MICSYRLKLKDGTELFFKTDDEFSEWLATEGTSLVKEYEIASVTDAGNGKVDKTKNFVDLSKINKKDTDKSGEDFDNKYDLLRQIREGKYETIQTPEIQWFKDTFKDYPVVLKVVSNVINSNAWGKFTTDGTYLYNAAASGTAYHEAWHNFTQLFLTKSEKLALYKETKENVEELKNSNDKEVEEWLADRFMEYAQSNGTEPAPTFRKNIFQRIWDIIRELFGYRTIDPDKLFKDLYTGNLESYDFSKSNAIWGDLNSSISNNGRVILNTEEVNIVFNHFDTILGQYLELNNKYFNELVESNAVKTFNDIKEYVTDSLINDVNEYIKPLYYADPESVYSTSANIMSKLFIEDRQNFEVVFKEWVNTINKKITITDLNDDDSISEEEIDELEEDEKEAVDNRVGDFEQKSLIQTISKESKALIRTLSKVELNEKGLPVIEDGKVVLKRNEYGFYTPVNFTNFVNTLGFILADSLDFDEMLEKMQDPANQKLLPELSLLIERLAINKPRSVYKTQLLASFERDFKRSYVGVFDSTISKFTPDGEDAKPILKSFFAEETKQGIEFVKKKFYDNFISLPKSEFTQIGDDGRKFVSANLIKLIDKFSTFQGSPSERRDLFLDIVYFLGIEFSENTLNSGDLESYLTKKSDIVNNSLLGIKGRLNKKEKLYDPVRDLMKISSLTKSSQASFIRSLLEIEEKYNPDSTSLTYLTAEGSKKYALMNPSYLFTVFNRIKNAVTFDKLVERPEFSHLTKSLIINSLFDKNGYRIVVDDQVKGKTRNNLTWGDYNGLKNDFDGKDIKKQTTSLTVRQKMIMDINNLFTHGVIDIMRTEASASSYFYKLDSYIHKYEENGQVKEIPVSKLPFNFSLLFNSTYRNLKSNIISSYFYDIYQSELEEGFGIMKDITEEKGLSKNEVYNAVSKYFNRETAEFIRFAAENGINESNFREYLNNDLLNDIDNGKVSYVELIRAFILNDFVLNVEYSKLIAGHPKYYKAYHKRAKTAISTGITLSTSNYIKEDLEATQNRTMSYALNGSKEVDLINYTSKVVKDPVGKISESLKLTWRKVLGQNEKINAYDKFNPADGQGRITFDAYRQFRKRTGTWLNIDEINYVREVVAWKKRKGLTVSNLENNILAAFKDEPVVVFPVIKAQYAGVDKKGRPIVHKFSLAPMIPSVIEGTPLDNYSDDLIREGIAYFTHESGSKVFNEELAEFTKNGIEFSLDKKGNQNLFSLYLKEQIPPSSEKKTKSNWGTQLRKLFMTNLFDKGETLDKFKDLKNNYVDTLEYIKEVQTKKLYSKFGIIEENGQIKIQDIKPFIDTILEQFNSRDMSDAIKESIKYDSVTKSFEYPLEINLNVQDIRNLISGMVDRELRRIEVPGDQLVMVSAVGMEDPENPLKFYEPEFVDGKFVRTKPMEVMIGFSKEYYSLLNLTHPDGNKINTRERLNQAIDNEVWRKENEKGLIHIGYRIPTQGPNSIDFAIIRKFLPETFYGIITPKEFVKKTGADFDIDKVFWIRPSYKDNGKVIDFINTSEDELKSIANMSDIFIIRGILKSSSFQLEEYNVRDVQNIERIEEKFNIQTIIKDNLALRKYKQDLASFTITKNEEDLIKKLNALRLVRDFLNDDIKKYKYLKASILPNYQEKIEELFKNKEEVVEELNRLSSELEDKRKQLFSSKSFKSELNKKLDELLLFRYPEEYNRQLNVLYQLRSPLSSAVNNVIDLYTQAMSSPEMFEQLITPNSSDMVRNEAIKMMKLKGLPEQIINLIENNLGFKNTAIFTPRVNYIKFYENMDGRKDLGMWAVNNTFSQLLQQAGVGMNSKYDLPLPDKGIIVKDLNFNQLLLPERQFGNSLSSLKNVDGTYVQEIISELINATVDIAADPFYAYLGINNENKGVAAYLLLQGIPFERVILFLNQPILQNFYKERINKPFTVTEKLVFNSSREIVINLLGNTKTVIDGKNITLDKYIKKDLLFKFYNSLTTNYLNTSGYFRSEQLKARISSGEFVNDDFAKATLAHFMELKSQADVFRKLQMSNNYDTTKYGTPINARRNLEMYEFVKNTGLFTNIEKINQRSFISIFDNRELLQDIYAILFPISFNEKVLSFLSEENIRPTVFSNKDYEKYEKKLASDLVEYIVKKYGVSESGENMSKYGLSLITKVEGSNNPLLFETYLNLMKKHPELKRYDLFRRITTNFEEKAPFRRNLEISRGLDNTTFTQNLLHEQYNKFLTQDVRTLLGKDLNPDSILEIRNFLKDLAYVGFFQSGFNKSKFFFGDIIPNDILRNRFMEAISIFEDIMENDKRLEEEMRIFITQFRNNNPEFFDNTSKQSYRGKSYGLSGVKVQEDKKKIEKPDTYELSGVKVLNDEYISNFRRLSSRSLPEEFFVPELNYLPGHKGIYKTEQSQVFVKNALDYYDLIDKVSGEVLLENVELESGFIAVNTSRFLSIKESKVKKMPFWNKDQLMAISSTKAIAAPLTPKTSYQSSSIAYVETLKGKGVLNRYFTASDVVWIFGNIDNYGGITAEDNKSNFEKKYVPLIDEALTAGVQTFNIGLASGIDTLASEYLKSKGFMNVNKGGWNKWVRDNTVDNSDKINIYAGTNENVELSNFAIRPFRINYGASFTDFNSVEQAYQAAKKDYSEDSQFNSDLEEKILDSKNGFEAKKLGAQFKGLNIKEWDENSSRIMKKFLLESFKQNPKALEKLLATGNAELTHTQDKGKWRTEFPKLLMEVRDELNNKITPEEGTTKKC
jgi:ribA/ribD-fused uncharacterized protein